MGGEILNPALFVFYVQKYETSRSPKSVRRRRKGENLREVNNLHATPRCREPRQPFDRPQTFNSSVSCHSHIQLSSVLKFGLLDASCAQEENFGVEESREPIERGELTRNPRSLKAGSVAAQLMQLAVRDLLELKEFESRCGRCKIPDSFQTSLISVNIRVRGFISRRFAK